MGASTENGDMPIPGHAMVMSVDFKDAGMRFHGNPLRMLQENASNNGLTLYCKSLGFNIIIVTGHGLAPIRSQAMTCNNDDKSILV